MLEVSFATTHIHTVVESIHVHTCLVCLVGQPSCLSSQYPLVFIHVYMHMYICLHVHVYMLMCFTFMVIDQCESGVWMFNDIHCKYDYHLHLHVTACCSW